MQITPAGADDVDALAQVHASTWQAACKSFLPADDLASLDSAQRQAWWREQIASPGVQILIASDAAGVQGWICFGAALGPDDSIGEGEIWALQAAPRAWSRGVGRMLWLRAREAMLKLGWRSCSLRISAHNRQAIRFLRAAGFVAAPSAPTRLLRVGERLRPGMRYVQVIARQRGAHATDCALAGADAPGHATESGVGVEVEAGAGAGAGPTIELAGLQLLRGCKGGLDERTAIVLLRLDLPPGHLAQLESRLRQTLQRVAARLSWGLDPDEEPLTDLLQPGGSGFGAALAALTVALQRCAGEPVWRARVLEQDAGRLRIALPWQREAVLRDALMLALQQAVQPQPDGVSAAIERWLGQASLGGLPPGTLRFYAAARRREIPASLQAGALRLGWGCRSERFDGSVSGRTSHLATQAAGSQRLTRELLLSSALPVAPAQLVSDAAAAREAAERLGWPVTVRPAWQDRLVVAGIASETLLAQAFDAAARLSPGAVVVEKQLDGQRHHLLVVAGRLIASDSPAARDGAARTIHPDNRALAERAARIVGLDIAEVELACPDLSRSWRDGAAAILGVSARPDFGTRWQGDAERDLAGEVIDCLFDDHSWRIPTTAIGASDCGDSTLMLHHIWLAAGLNAGSATAGGLWIGQERIASGNLSGQTGGALLLADPAVEAAAIEMPLQALLTSGHPCDRYGVAALLDVDADAGLPGGRERLTALAGELLERAVDAVVLNADDPLCLMLEPRATAARLILVAADASAPALNAHLAQGGEAVFATEHRDGRWIVFAKGGSHAPLMPFDEVAAGALAADGQRHALFAAALAWAQGVGPALIRHALASFARL